MVYTIAIILHFIWDWILQPRDVANNKSKDINVLREHMISGWRGIYLYLVIIWVIFLPVGGQGFMWLFLFVFNFYSHMAIDWWLSKILYPKLSERQLINTIAIDQMLHLTILTLSITYLL